MEESWFEGYDDDRPCERCVFDGDVLGVSVGTTLLDGVGCSWHGQRSLRRHVRICENGQGVPCDEACGEGEDVSSPLSVELGR